MAPPPRLIDLHCDWLLQYAQETTVFDPALYEGVADRLGQAEGYLSATSASVLSCFRRAADWASQADPWAALMALVTRIEAEFPGRLLIGQDDHARWLDDVEAGGLCWAVIGVEGFDALVRGPDDLERLPALFDRGVRLFQPVYSPSNVLAGSSAAGDDRGLTDLGRSFLQTLAELPQGTSSPRALLDLAHMNPAAGAEVLDWFEDDARRSSSLIPVYSHGGLRHDGFVSPRAITLENLGRLRSLGGLVGFSVGPPFYETAAQIREGIEAAAALPFEGRPGFEGIAIGTDFLGVDRTLPGLSNVEGVVAWLRDSFAPETADALTSGNARRLIERAVGAGPS